MGLYHITDTEYKIGQIIDVQNFEGGVTHYHANAGKNQWIDDFLSAERPDGVPNRSLAVYAFEKLKYCERFEKVGQHIYKVEMEVKARCPMRLVRDIETNKERIEFLNVLRNEYWHPTLGWKVMEILSNKFTVVELKYTLTGLMLCQAPCVKITKMIINLQRSSLTYLLNRNKYYIMKRT